MGANAQTSVPAFTAGQILTAQQQTQINTGIPVFADTTARDAAFGGTGEKTLAEGQFAYLENSNTTQYYDGAAWQTLVSVTPRIGQVVSTAKTDTFSTSSLSFTDITGLSVTITPTLATSKILVLAQYSAGISGDIQCGIRLVRDATAINIGDAAGSRTKTTNAVYGIDAGSYSATQITNQNMSFLDSPATTSATTYKLQMFVNTGTGYINRASTDTDNGTKVRTASNITVMEILV